MLSPSIFEYIKGEENKFLTDEIRIGDNWNWNFRSHVQLIFHLKNGIFFTGENEWLRSFKNIMEPILNLSYWTEDIEVKDVVFYIENDEGKVLSFLVKKYYEEVYLKEHDLDTLFDEITESDLDYGGVVVQQGAEIPEVLPLLSIAFCDQTDILGGPIGTKHYFSPDKFRKMSEYGWGEERNGATMSLDEICILATNEKEVLGQTGDKNETTGKNIEVYIVRGSLPEHYLYDDNNMEDYCNQIQVVAFYTDQNKRKQGVVIYRKKEEDSNLKFFTSKKVYQRGLGRGVGESLLHPQIWTNFLSIHKINLLEAASKIPLYTDDQSYTTKNKIQDMENLEITTIEDNKRIYQVPTAAPNNIQLIQGAINEWYEHAQVSGAAFDPIMGKESVSGTTFRGQERTVAQGQGLHNRRRGQRAKFLEEIFRDWIIPDIKKNLLKGKKFLATLTTEELRWVAEELSIVMSNKKIKDLILSGKDVTKEQQDLLISLYKQSVLKKGNKQLIEILKGEFDGIEISMGINIAGKQKDLASLSDKLLSVFQFIFSNPAGFQQAMQIPALQKSFENILEFSGMSIGDFSSLLQSTQQPETLMTPTANPTNGMSTLLPTSQVQQQQNV